MTANRLALTSSIGRRGSGSINEAFARYVQCEQAISKFGLLGKHPTTGAAIASPFVAMSQSFGKQANVYWYEIYEIVRATCTTDYAGTTPGDEVMEQLLNARS